MSSFQTTIGPDLIDEYGHVNYKDFPGLFEPAQDDFMAERGCSFEEIERRWSLRSFVCRLAVLYKRPVLAGQAVRILTTVSSSVSSASYHQVMECSGDTVAELDLLVVFVGKDGRPSSIPQELREILSERRE